VRFGEGFHKAGVILDTLVLALTLALNVELNGALLVFGTAEQRTRQTQFRNTIT
jgi:hypothetical protein